MNIKTFKKFLNKKFKVYPGGIRYGFSDKGDVFFYEDIIDVIQKTSPQNPYARDFLIIYTSVYNYKQPEFLLMSDGYYHKAFLWKEFINWVNTHYSKIIKRQEFNEKHKKY